MEGPVNEERAINEQDWCLAGMFAAESAWRERLRNERLKPTVRNGGADGAHWDESATRCSERRFAVRAPTEKGLTGASLSRGLCSGCPIAASAPGVFVWLHNGGDAPEILG